MQTVPLSAVPILLQILASPDHPNRDETLTLMCDLVASSFGEDGDALGSTVRESGGLLTLSWLLADETLSRALVLDLDVHQGDGTAEIFADEPRVETISLHCEDNFPFRKARSDVDLGLPAGTGDSGYLQALDGLLTEITGRARDCDLIVLNAGVDPHADDRLGRLALSEDGLAQRDLMVFDWARDVAKPLCVVMGGGYDHRIDVIAERHARVYDRLFQAASRG